MESVKLQLRFGTALFTFNSEKQMRNFLSAFCFKDGKGCIFLHHGAQYHEFTELCKNHYKRIPSDLKFDKRNRTSFMRGSVTEKEDMTI